MNRLRPWIDFRQDELCPIELQSALTVPSGQ